MKPSIPDNLDLLTADYVKTHGQRCAALTLTNKQKAYYLSLFGILALFLVWRWDLFVLIMTALMVLCYLPAVLLRVLAAAISFPSKSVWNVSEKERNELSDDTLPVYTVLIPLYKESAVAGTILKNLAALDYPKNKLDVKLLLECDDEETRTALARTVIPPWCECIEVPDGPIRTKPRACNYGLQRAKGEFCVIFDAEDRPEPDQLKKAVCIFRNHPSKNLLCVQAKLNYFNARQNLLTRLFTIEYCTNFDLQLPGLSEFDVPLPLGGTSNHFRTEGLRTLGGWDPFNVTEDCDLGIRIYEIGCRTTVMESTTWEEANSDLWNWMRQRSRWVKGFLQTHLVHFRSKRETFRRLGARGFFGCWMFVGGSVVMMLANLVFWPVIFLYLLLLCHGCMNGETVYSQIVGPYPPGAQMYQGLDLGFCVLKAWPLVYSGPGENIFFARASQIFFSAGVVLFLTNILLVFMHLLACVKRRFFFLVPYSLLMPFYWIMISLAAWKGAIQFLTKPFYWEKTIHGLGPSGPNSLPINQPTPSKQERILS